MGNCSICFFYESEDFVRDQWLLNSIGFKVPCWELNTPSKTIIRKEDLTTISSFDELPDDFVKVLVTPLTAREVPGEQDLLTYKHPERAVYIFGNNDFYLQQKDIPNDVVNKVYIPVETEFWSPQAASIVLWDRLVKNGNT